MPWRDLKDTLVLTSATVAGATVATAAVVVTVVAGAAVARVVVASVVVVGRASATGLAVEKHIFYGISKY